MQNLQEQWRGSATEALVALLSAYQKILSPDHGIFRFLFGGARCRFYPTCSAYARDALRQYGLLRGVVVTLRRVLRCHPLSSGGYDPLPPEGTRARANVRA